MGTTAGEGIPCVDVTLMRHQLVNLIHQVVPHLSKDGMHDEWPVYGRRESISRRSSPSSFLTAVEVVTFFAPSGSPHSLYYRMRLWGGAAKNKGLFRVIVTQNVWGQCETDEDEAMNVKIVALTSY